MGHQVRFYMAPDDEREFIEFLSKEPDVALLAPHSSEAQPRVLEGSEVLGSQDKELRVVFLWNTLLPLNGQDIVRVELQRYETAQAAYVKTGEVRYSISASSAPVVEFSRSFLRNPTQLTQGRIWADFNRLREGRMESKGEAFQAWYTRIAGWIRRNGKRLSGVDGHVLPQAVEWNVIGGIELAQ